MNNTERLLNTLIPFAQQQLEKTGEFAPFGGTISEEKKEIHLAMVTSDKNADSQKMIDLMTEGFKSKIVSDKLVATGLCFNTVMKTSEGSTDAICVATEEKNGKSFNIFLPYIKDSGGKISYEELVVSNSEAIIFN